MADTVTTARVLGIGIDWYDTSTEKERTTYIKVPNPKNSLTEEQVRTAAGALITNGILLNDNGGSLGTDTTIVSTAYTEDQEVIDIDIGVES